ncbi:hypothetical protein [Aminobacter aminovorans]|uniref:Uncharacterized protein n=1 Tax=Aminobacter aminovorans TaxID=83263 RepID=A0AAC8YNF6_AMIAI|nr:hypothetical protein [Aminobacter aminovorans]AMS41194.1 hypothetical protein AA2016_2266 [Aminobacter aminovorans]MBB3705823.1 hypothetical protein [Aminobacter aminovorans]
MTAIHERPNRASAKEAASFVEEFDRLEQTREEKLRLLDADFKTKKRAIQKEVDADQKTLLADAKKQGVNKGVIRAISDAQKIKRKAEALLERAEGKVDGLEDDDREFAVDIRTALGNDFANFGLGAAAVAREDSVETNKPDATTAAVIAAVKGSMSDEDWDAAARPN